MIDGKFPFAVYRKDVGHNSVLCLFWKYWVFERCNGTSGKVMEYKFNFPTCGSQETGTREYQGKESDGHSLEVMKKFCHLSD